MEQEFQLFQKRDFSALVSDTIQFFKTFWKPYFKSYLVINGILLIAVVAVYFLLFKDLFANLLSGNKNHFLEIVDENPALFSFYVFLLMAFGLLFVVFSTLYPMAFLRSMKSDYEDQKASFYLNSMKSDIGRVLVFGIISFLLLFPLMMIVFVVGALLSIILIGIPVLVLGIPAFFVWGNQACYVFVEERVGYFSALGKGWKILFSNFFHHTGATIIMYICLWILSSVFTLVPTMASVGSIVSSGHAPGVAPMGVMTAVLYIIGMIVSYLGYNLLYVQQGLIYYSSQESEIHEGAYHDIDTIGQNEN